MATRYSTFFIMLFFLATAIGCKLDAPVYPKTAVTTGTGTTGTGTTGTGTTGTGTTGTGTTGTGTTGTGTTGTGTTGTGTTGTGTTGTGTTGTGTTGTGTTGTGTTGTGTTGTTANDGVGLPIPTFIGVEVQIDGGPIQKFTATSTFSALLAGSTYHGAPVYTSNTIILATNTLTPTDPSQYFTLTDDDYRAGTYDIDLIMVGNYSYSNPTTSFPIGPPAGSVRITSLTATNIQGSFKVDLTDANGKVHPNAIGSFNVNAN